MVGRQKKRNKMAERGRKRKKREEEEEEEEGERGGISFSFLKKLKQSNDRTKSTTNSLYYCDNHFRFFLVFLLNINRKDDMGDDVRVC